jgi:hypothetical protein
MKKISIQSANFEKILSQDLIKGFEEIKEQVIATMCIIGEMVVRKAREVGSYNDITGNLRSSIGYVVLDDGQEVGMFTPEQVLATATEGAGKARELLDSLRSRYPSGIVLIICAGMEYGQYVEAIHHRDVLTSGELEMERLSDKLITAIFSNAE